MKWIHTLNVYQVFWNFLESCLRYIDTQILETTSFLFSISLSHIYMHGTHSHTHPHPHPHALLAQFVQGFVSTTWSQLANVMTTTLCWRSFLLGLLILYKDKLFMLCHWFPLYVDVFSSYSWAWLELLAPVWKRTSKLANLMIFFFWICLYKSTPSTAEHGYIIHFLFNSSICRSWSIRRYPALSSFVFIKNV